MNELNPLVSPLVGNCNALSSHQLMQWLGTGAISESDLRRVLPPQMFDDLMHAPRPSVVGRGARLLPLTPDDAPCTEVYFWGLRNSGKSMAIASLLAAQPDSLSQNNSKAGSDRANQQIEAFSPEGKLTHFPISVNDELAGASNVVRVDLRSVNGRRSRTCPVTLIECAATDDAIDIENTSYTYSTSDKIHILCWDPTNPSPDKQENALVELLESLKDNKILSHTVGIYLMVTKVDYYQFNDLARQKDIAQQTFIAEHDLIWSMVKNFGCEEEVRGIQPVPFTIGQVFLQDLVKVDLSPARSLIENQLLPKCQPAPSLLEKFLSYGSLSVTIVLVLALCVGIGYTAFQAFAGIASPPSRQIAALDYRTYFLKEESRHVKDHTFDNCYKKYLDLDNDLKTEKFVRDGVSGQPLFIDSRECEEILCNDYAKSLHARNLKEFELTRWGAYLYLKKRVEEILPNRLLNAAVRDDLRSDSTILSDSQRARSLDGSCRRCHDWRTLDSLTAESARLGYAPIVNDKAAAECLARAPYEAYTSYVDFIARRVDSRLYDKGLCRAYRDTLIRLNNKPDLPRDVRRRAEDIIDIIDSRYPTLRFYFW